MAKSTIIMAFFFTIPISSTMPTMAMMERSMPNNMRVTTAPKPALGKPERMVMG